MIGDRELLSFRQGYYTLLVSLFWKEPARELLVRIRDGIKERIDASRSVHALLAEGWEEVNHFLAETPSEKLAEAVWDEYTLLFIGPYGAILNPYESFYFTGRLLDRPLADVRAFLKTVGLAKKDEYTEPEDFLAFELEVMRWLIGKQESSTQPEEERRWLQHQASFLKQHLLVWAPTCAQDIEKASGAKFYRGAAKVLRGFLEAECTLCSPEWGLDKVAPLEEVRRIYGAMPMWKGPTFDFSPDETSNAPMPSRQK